MPYVLHNHAVYFFHVKNVDAPKGRTSKDFLDIFIASQLNEKRETVN